MINFNFHQHSLFSDGKMPPEEYVKQAIELGFVAMGFTEHSPLPFETYFALPQHREQEYIEETNRLTKKYVDKIKLYRALEQDFIPGVTEVFSAVSKRLQLAYSIGSVHLVKPEGSDDLWFIDGPERQKYDDGLDQFFGGDIRKGVTQYYRQMNQMIESQVFDVVGHLDKIKMHNAGRFFNPEDSWVQELVDETLDLIKEKSLIVEVNTRGIYKKRADSYFPDHSTLKKVQQLKIPIIISSDAHLPEELNLGFTEAGQHLLDFEFTNTMFLNGNGWIEIPL
ncbi:MAG: histidinol-phosphatase [Bacteroidales bacterium]|jgi:histidinol-phosphatase (PHP family)